jgi:large subunit ribosomal protein L32
MAALPKKKLARSRSKKRYATKGYSTPKLAVCDSCGQKKLPHTLCPNCGSYKGKVIIKPKESVKVKKVEENER